ncbi:MAG: GPW/gp25 family protein [Chloroflexota bacterium]
METNGVGRGWHLPLNLQTHQSAQDWLPNLGHWQQLVMLTDGTNEIQQAIRIILLTAPGERVMRPEFGCRIHELLFEPNNRATAVRAEQYITEALTRWEPRITINQVEAKPQAAHLNVHITYTIQASNDEQNLVYPFYLTPGE